MKTVKDLVKLEDKNLVAKIIDKFANSIKRKTKEQIEDYNIYIANRNDFIQDPFEENLMFLYVACMEYLDSYNYKIYTHLNNDEKEYFNKNIRGLLLDFDDTLIEMIYYRYNKSSINK